MANAKPGLPAGIELQVLDHGFTDIMKTNRAKILLVRHQWGCVPRGSQNDTVSAALPGRQ